MSRKKAAAGPGTPATTALTHAGVAYTTHPYTHDPASGLGYGLEAAAALGVPPEAVFKTLVVHVDGLRGSGLAVGVVPVSASLDLKAIARALGHKKATMADGAAAERSSGYVMGGISPIGQRTALPTVVDTSAHSLVTMYVSGGRRGFDLGLAPADLVAVTGGRFAPIAH
ncbi:Cys-tRNA(Pro) deacylase [Occultella glacieicola]|uniref:Cys-tRNA(Pro)/Cys-tRNA(Cys) deacylase n=1 Tax=Occultella glacieicola TaxID=2518684 RepID=A0ABY2E5I5_9MICO|nr:Cys-tRNA(Pro) deacylase [Occultella glacieicola]TDE95857.1 Cys-tRNA(Pro) deacylase [Occultella glacieicola]